MARLLAFGAGAIGSVTGAYIKRGGVEITLVDPWYQHVEAVKSRGLEVITPDGDFKVDIDARHLDELPDLEGPFDIVFLALKSYDTLWACQVIEHYLAPQGIVVSTQNGINEDLVSSTVGRRRTVGCVVHTSAGLYEPGRVTRTSGPAWATFTIGELDGAPSARVAELAELMSLAGETHTTDNIWGELWAKLTLNCMGNALAGITGCSTRELWSDPKGVALMIHLGGEAAAVCAAVGYTMDPLRPAGADRGIDPGRLQAAHEGDREAWDEVFAQFAGVAAKRTGARENKASLLQDMLKGRRTEVSHLNGYVARRGAEAGVQAPYNQAMPGLIAAVESGRLSMTPDNLKLVRPD